MHPVGLSVFDVLAPQDGAGFPTPFFPLFYVFFPPPPSFPLLREMPGLANLQDHFLQLGGLQLLPFLGEGVLPLSTFLDYARSPGPPQPFALTPGDARSAFSSPLTHPEPGRFFPSPPQAPPHTLFLPLASQVFLRFCFPFPEPSGETRPRLDLSWRAPFWPPRDCSPFLSLHRRIVFPYFFCRAVWFFWGGSFAVSDAPPHPTQASFAFTCSDSYWKVNPPLPRIDPWSYSKQALSYCLLFDVGVAVFFFFVCFLSCWFVFLLECGRFGIFF